MTDLSNKTALLWDAGTLERFISKVTFLENGCWLWMGPCYWNGYGRFSVKHRWQLAHRVSYRMFVGEPTLSDLDHICHNRDASCAGGYHCLHRRCVNPEHMENVSHQENMVRGKTIVAIHVVKTHCPNGHPYDEENTYYRPDGRGRTCKECTRQRNREARRQLVG